VQSQINQEFDRVLELERVIPADMLSGAESRSMPREPHKELPQSREIQKESYDLRQEAKPEMRLTRLESASLS